ncbi:Chromate resistance protein ChrB [Nocardioides sp. NPDC059952]|uniref:Chromate resistance protein ChrB n=1 Tax=Nocardioides sp. NPDC059952 TaxID=3347014 RepID=UPI003655957D
MAQIDEPGEWVFLTYSLPRDPSTPRLALWRSLKRLGVVQLADGLVALPADARTREQLEWAAEQTVGSGGRASVWLARPTTRAQGRDLAQTMNSARTEEYQVVIDDAVAALDAEEVDRIRALRRLRAENNRIRRRDFFRPPAREQARQALTTLAATLHDNAIADLAEPEVRR